MKSLYSKFIVTTLVIMLVSSVIGFLFANAYYQNSLKPENDTKNMEIATSIAEFAEDQSDLDEYLSHTAATGYQLFLVSQEERRYYGGAFKEKNISQQAIEAVLDGEPYHGMKAFPKKTFVTGFFANELKNSVGVPLTYDGKQYALFLRPDIKLLFNEIHLLLGWMVLVIFILSLLAELVWSAMLIRPIRKLSHATNKVREEGFDVHLDIHRRDEIGQLAQNFKEMIARLGKLDTLRKSFVSNVSHDIQTPLLTIQGYSRLLENNALSEEDRKAYLRVIQEETERMSILSKQLLTLSSLESKEKDYVRNSFDLSAQLKSLLYRYYWLIDEKNLSLTYSVDEVTYEGNPELLYTVWENLLTNAIKYNEPGGSIEVTLEKGADATHITFADTGIGLASNEKDQIFDRFYRADLARTRTNQGTGLGLSIVKEIIELHQGDIVVDSQLGKGTTFTITLPHL
ncbi:sensor histidine kinase [Bacillus sp. RAR_GA_16]|uniref:sensor histidine kinase n=1 Tax=Bacillus sp. RAR_GA_16 TaxID=2876774 RepID=UPI001CCBFEDD|nr:HAMP domain-containing sensor histidine kinase [Bacillus sp. RAR_GA_16]MCA0172935.1 HAMP domain-containing histidine kinase [Bacillus sp. RAR_GA_16]